MWKLSGISNSGLKSFKTGFSKISPVVYALFWAEGNQDPLGSQELLSTSLKEFKSGALPILSVIIRNNFLRPIWRIGKHLNTEHLLSPYRPANDSSPLKPQGILFHPLAQNVTYTSVSEPLMYVGVSDSPMYVGFL